MLNVKLIGDSEHYYVCGISILTRQVHCADVFKIVLIKKTTSVKQFDEVKAKNQYTGGSAICSA